MVAAVRLLGLCYGTTAPPPAAPALDSIEGRRPHVPAANRVGRLTSAAVGITFRSNRGRRESGQPPPRASGLPPMRPNPPGTDRVVQRLAL